MMFTYGIGMKSVMQTALVVASKTPRIVSVRSLGSAQRKLEEKKSGDPKITFYHRDLEIHEATAEERQPRPGEGEDLKFGHFYADHMVEVDWDVERGWTKPQIHGIRNIHVHPGAKVLHYAIELFEGMKAYRGIDNKIRLFRADMNMARMRRTAKRAALPDFDAEELIKIISEQIKLDREWVPYSSTSSLYIRPTLIGTDHTLGVGDPHQAKLFVLTGPVGQYYATGFQPVKLLADSQFVRAFQGGVGAYKMGCNYAPTINVGKLAAEKGCQQVLWLSGADEELTEVGTMNVFVYWKNEQGEKELLTPSLSKGLILPGVTRDSLIELGHQWNDFKVTEGSINMEQLRRALKEKRLYEMFGAGTACVVSPIGKILYHNKQTGAYEEWSIPTMQHQPNLMQRYYEHITDIQYGRIEQPGWMREVC